MTLDEAVECAERDLPRLWSIEIVVEGDSSWVDLRAPWGNTIELDKIDSTTPLAEQVMTAISIARGQA